ncbi:hypothetical protein FACS1894200_00430 [Spirochaetia bacterium]|nr:hypothetical protein FACS1894200_00430 [Spirochaetia bacterium]
MGTINASWQDIEILVDNITKNLKSIDEYNGALDSQLRMLGATFRDEGITVIQNHIARTKKQIEEAIPDFKVMLGNLLAYARKLKQSEDAIRLSAVVGAAVVAVAGTVSVIPPKNMNAVSADINTVSAVYTDAGIDAPPATNNQILQNVEQNLPGGYRISNRDEVLSPLSVEEPDKWQVVADLAKAIVDMTEKVMEAKKKKKDALDNKPPRESEYGDSPDPP